VIKLGLLGHNISYSKSPIIHQMIADKNNLKLSYDLIDLDENDFTVFMNNLKNTDYKGLNVTIPYKQKVIPFLDYLTPQAQKIGAVNTIYQKNNLLIGDNTDYNGFLALLKNTNINFSNKKILVLGTGASAKTIKVVLDDLSLSATYVTSSNNQDSYFNHIINYQQINTHYDVVINATPVGTLGNEKSPLSKSLVKESIVIDLVYNPAVTLLMSYAKESYNGLTMLIQQALAAQKIFFGQQVELSASQIKEMEVKIYE